MSAKTTAYFIGGPADGAVRGFDTRPPDRMQASPEQGSLLTDKPTIYTRSDLTGGVAIYVPMGTLLHDAFERVLATYVEVHGSLAARKESEHD